MCPEKTFLFPLYSSKTNFFIVPPKIFKKRTNTLYHHRNESGRIMLLLYSGCIFWRSNIGVGYQEPRQSPHPELHLSSSLRYLHIAGPSTHIHLTPEFKSVSAGWEMSPALLFGSWLPIDEIESRSLKQSYLLSAVGTDFLTVSLDEEKPVIHWISPYIQIHSPTTCTVQTREEMICFSGFGEVQYHMLSEASDNLTWNLGISIHYGYGFFPF